MASNVFIVNLEDDFVAILESWKRKAISLHGWGGIKRRFKELILEDLKEEKNVAVS